MLNLEDLKSRVLLLLGDEEGTRFGGELVENAIRQGLAHLDEKIPQILTIESLVATGGRDQTLSGLENPIHLVEVRLKTALGETVRTSLEYAYTLQGTSAALHFSGLRYPQAGEILEAVYAACHKLAGLDDAESSSLPDSAAGALETCCAAQACLLRAAAVVEAYGARPGESTRLVEQSRMWMEAADTALAKLHNQGQFGYPAGFALDAWDQDGGLR